VGQSMQLNEQYNVWCAYTSINAGLAMVPAVRFASILATCVVGQRGGAHRRTHFRRPKMPASELFGQNAIVSRKIENASKSNFFIVRASQESKAHNLSNAPMIQRIHCPTHIGRTQR
ncbi:MAG TPA: hypothetical protein VGX78_20610, partial [Pirellulales bacterium]|nr:hypothetical protein [Pirellulales bacterium]